MLTAQLRELPLGCQDVRPGFITVEPQTHPDRIDLTLELNHQKAKVFLHRHKDARLFQHFSQFPSSRFHASIDFTVEKPYNAQYDSVVVRLNQYTPIPYEAPTVVNADYLSRELTRYVTMISDEVYHALCYTFLTDARYHIPFSQAPASMKHGFSFKHGLLFHTVKLMETITKWCERKEADRQQLYTQPQLVPSIDRDLLLTAALFHDIGKLATLTGSDDETDLTLEGELLGVRVTGIRMMSELFEVVKPQLMGRYLASELKAKETALLHIMASCKHADATSSFVAPQTPSAVLFASFEALESMFYHVEHLAMREAVTAPRFARLFEGQNIYLTPKVAPQNVPLHEPQVVGMTTPSPVPQVEQPIGAVPVTIAPGGWVQSAPPQMPLAQPTNMSPVMTQPSVVATAQYSGMQAQPHPVSYPPQSVPNYDYMPQPTPVAMQPTPVAPIPYNPPMPQPVMTDPAFVQPEPPVQPSADAFVTQLQSLVAAPVVSTTPDIEDTPAVSPLVGIAQNTTPFIFPTTQEETRPNPAPVPQPVLVKEDGTPANIQLPPGVVLEETSTED